MRPLNEVLCDLKGVFLDLFITQMKGRESRLICDTTPDQKGVQQHDLHAITLGFHNALPLLSLYKSGCISHCI